ncbi:PilZ domain-containing protein [Leptospira idonii]|uniref:PilZ domain-containing protein n=1 Tax=Leptospira idonii TaxID=1193500 RepID=A0A4R9M6M6_9LEPT|nr:PilZ domain-containing protein [Leptospira idonii]TGN20328.1 PilZ domain-containing protein [Leptospira idonii]
MADQSKSIFSDSYSMYGGAKQKRKKARVKLDIPCEVSLVNSKSSPIMAQMSDLGTGGLSLQTTSTFYPGDAVKIGFVINRVKTEIVGTVQRTSGKTTSVVFAEISSDTHNIIQEYIHKHYFDPKAKK